MKATGVAGRLRVSKAPAAEPSTGEASPLATDLVTRQAQELRDSAGRRVWSTLLDLRDWPSYVYIPILLLLLFVLPWEAYQYRRRANANATIVEAITHGSPDMRKIFQVVQGVGDQPTTPLPVLEASQASSSPDYRGFEFLSDTSIVDLREWRSKSRDLAHYYRRLRVRKLKEERVLTLLYPHLPFDRIDFYAASGSLKPTVRRPPTDAPGKTTWELAFDMSNIRAGKAVDLEIEATVHDFEERKGEREHWLRYAPPAQTEQASVWVLFPESRPYKDYRLIRYAKADPTQFQEIETQYMIDHPYGSIIAWSIVNAEPGFVYECSWTVESRD